MSKMDESWRDWWQESKSWLFASVQQIIDGRIATHGKVSRYWVAIKLQTTMLIPPQWVRETCPPVQLFNVALAHGKGKSESGQQNVDDGAEILVKKFLHANRKAYTLDDEGWITVLGTSKEKRNHE